MYWKDARLSVYDFLTMDYNTKDIPAPKNDTRRKQKPVVESSRQVATFEGQTGSRAEPSLNFDNLSLDQLEQYHVDYQNNIQVWRKIDALRQGFPAIQANADFFLPKRPAEDDELYKLRTAKLAYSPIMSHVVHTYSGKMVESGLDFPSEKEAEYHEIRENNAHEDRPKRDEQGFMSEVFSGLLYYGRCYVLIDVPKSAEESRSAYELKSSKLMPFFCLVPVHEIINWGDDWLIRKQFISESKPFTPIATYAVYTYMSEGISVKYKIPVQTAMMPDPDGVKYPVVNKVYYKGEWVKPDDSIKYNPEEVLDVGIERMVSTEISDDQWLCLALFNKQIQHLRIENSWTDAGYLSGTVQRVFTPSDPVVADDPRVNYDQGAVEEQLKKAGMPTS